MWHWIQKLCVLIYSWKVGRRLTLQLRFSNTIAIWGIVVSSRNSVSWIMFHKPIWTLTPFFSHSANVYWASAMGQAPASSGSTLTNVTVSLPPGSSSSTREDIRLIIIIQGITCYNRAGSLNIGAVDIWGWIILCCGGLSVHCRMSSRLPGLRLLDSKRIPPLGITDNNVNRQWQTSLGEHQCPSPPTPLR